jgi:hypothetical protein
MTKKSDTGDQERCSLFCRLSLLLLESAAVVAVAALSLLHSSDADIENDLQCEEG